MKENEKRGGSALGFHFHNMFQNCPRKFYIRRILRIKNKYVSSPLINGSAFHEGKETFYKTRSEAKAVRRAKTVVKESEKLFETVDEYEQVLYKAPTLLEYWINTFGIKDLERYEVLFVEKEVYGKLPGLKNYFFSGKPDAILRDKLDDVVYIFETKTSSYSIRLTEDGVTSGDQATTYLWLAKNLLDSEKIDYDRERLGVIPDIAYWNKIAKSLENISCVRPCVIRRSDEEIEDYKAQLASLAANISQRVYSLKTGKYNPLALFPRNTSWCLSYNRRCEYFDICRSAVERFKRAPRGFVRDRVKGENVFDIVDDKMVQT